MLLDLFITHYNELWEIGKPNLEMLSLQRCVDFSEINVTIVHDGTPAFPDEYFEGYPFKVNQVVLEHGGIAAVRNWCIDNSTAEWIRWNDFDDLFSSVYSLKGIMDALENGENFDLFWFDIYVEIGKERWIKNDRNPVVVHNKVFRRSFLVEKNVRFNEELLWCEDSAMLALMEMEIDHQKIGKIKCEMPLYVWLYRQGSLCNRDEIKLDNLMSFYKRHIYVAEEFLKRGKMDEYHTMVARVIVNSYYTLTQAGLKEDLSQHEKEVWEYFKAHKEEFLKCRKSVFDEVIAIENKDHAGEMTKQGILDWLKSLRLKHEGGD